MDNLLTWIVGGGSATVVLWLVSQIPQVSKWLSQFAPNVQLIVEFIFAAVLAVLAQAALQYIPASAMITLQPYFVTLSTLFTAFFGLQLTKSGVSTNSQTPNKIT